MSLNLEGLEARWKTEKGQKLLRKVYAALGSGESLRDTLAGFPRVDEIDSGLDLRGADLSEGYLCDADLSGADLSGAKLNSAYLMGANLSNANLSSANLIKANLDNANLDSANLSNANLCAANLANAKLNNACLINADLRSSDLSGACLSGANLCGTMSDDAPKLNKPTRIPKRKAEPSSKTRACSFCTENINAKAKRCPHCGEFLVPPARSDANLGDAGIDGTKSLTIADAGEVSSSGNVDADDNLLPPLIWYVGKRIEDYPASELHFSYSGLHDCGFTNIWTEKALAKRFEKDCQYKYPVNCAEIETVISAFINESCIFSEGEGAPQLQWVVIDPLAYKDDFDSELLDNPGWKKLNLHITEDVFPYVDTFLRTEGSFHEDRGIGDEVELCKVFAKANPEYPLAMSIGLFWVVMPHIADVAKRILEEIQKVTQGRSFEDFQMEIAPAIEAMFLEDEEPAAAAHSTTFWHQDPCEPARFLEEPAAVAHRNLDIPYEVFLMGATRKVKEWHVKVFGDPGADDVISYDMHGFALDILSQPLNIEQEIKQRIKLIERLSLEKESASEENEESASEERRGRRRIPKEVQREVWRRDEGRCIECGSKENLEYDHIIPVSKGGGNTVRNIQLLCEPCNRSKGNIDPGSWDPGSLDGSIR